MRISKPVHERFWAKVNKSGPNGCWIWTGYKINSGYGQIRDDNQRKTLVHRLSWEISVGPIPQGLNILHECDNRPCVNPDHLFVGTQSKNLLDAYSRTKLREARVNEAARRIRNSHGQFTIKERGLDVT